MVMRALMDQALNPATLAQLPKILNVVKEHIDTNLTVEELLALVGFGVRTNRSNMQMLMLPGRFSTPSEYNASYWIPSPRRISTMMAQHFGIEAENELQPVEPGSLRIAIQNHTGKDNVSFRRLMRNLRKAGYTRIYVAKSWSQPLKATRVVAQQGDENSAESVRSLLGFGEVRVESTGSLNSDISIQVGEDWLDKLSTPESSEDIPLL